MANSSSLCIPAIHVTTDEQAQYDSIASRLLRKAVTEYSNFHGYIDTDDWSLVRKKQQMSIYRSLSGTDDPHVTLMVGTGLIPGTLEDVMDGLYADNTYDFRTMKTLTTKKFVDGAVLNVSEKRIPEAPFRFAGIKWSAGKAAWGVVKHRDILTYERMGATMDAHGNELAFHVLQSIERPEWLVDAVREVKRARTATCYLYRRCNSRVQCFVWAESYDIGSTSRRVAEYVIAGALLSVVRSVACAEAKKCSKLIADARGKAAPSNVVCHVCHKSSGVFDHLRTCSGCIQKVCKSCSQHRPIFEVDQRTGRPVEDRFCKLCISKVVTAPLFSQQSIPRKSAHSDPGVLVRRTPVLNKARREKAQSAPQRFLAQSRHIKRPLLGMDSDPLSSDDEVEYAC
uniref:FYVE-type domain-containing protein n=1 Tax=Globisporangium ultimum (strain ATCC 200006 / CBS 805.95 / DAOM BR144) TaxID=431595 RepID=K3X126_GLOUD